MSPDVIAKEMHEPRSDCPLPLAGVRRSMFRIWDEMEFPWVAGLVMLLLFASRYVGSHSLPPHWTQYLVLGTVFPLGLLYFSLARPFRDLATVPARAVRLLLPLCFVVLCADFFNRNHSQNVVQLAELQLLLTLYLWHRLRRTQEVSGRVTFGPALLGILLQGVLGLFVLILIWDVSAKLGWWYELPKDALHYGSDAALNILIMFLLILGLWNGDADQTRVRKNVLRLLDVSALAAFFVCSLSTYHLFNTDAFHHWSVWISPAELVRQGRWLLWDVPSQYGYLSMLTIAALPFHSVWQSLYVGIIAAQFVAAAVLYGLFRLRGGSVASAVMALVVTWIAVFLAPGMAPFYSGPIVFPGSSAYRFVWCFALLGLLAWDYHRYAGLSRRRVLVLGSILWLAGFFWSAESAIYCTLIWFPAGGLLLWRRHQSLRSVVSGLLASLALLGVILGGLDVFYRLRLGHAPDWLAFYEYGVAFKNAFNAWPLDPSGPVWVLVLSLCLISVTAVFVLRRGGASHSAASLVVGTWGASWATSSYFMSRSHPNNVDNLLPFCCAAIAVTLRVYADRSEFEGRFLKALCVPIFASAISMMVSNPLIGDYPVTVAQGYNSAVVKRLPMADVSLTQLLARAHVRPTDPLVYLDLNHMPSWDYDDGTKMHLISTPYAWLPVMPYSLMQPLTMRRQDVYTSRFVTQTHLSGWLIEPKTNVDLNYDLSSVYNDPRLRASADAEIENHFISQILKTHTPGRVFENADYRLTWYQLRPAQGLRTF